LPLYLQLKEILKQRILSEEWKTRARIPTELDLIREFDVSRTTVREAVAELAREGLLEKRQGRGTFVRRPPLEVPLKKLTGFAEEVLERGQVPSAALLSAGFVWDHFYEMYQLQIPKGEPVLRIERIRLADRAPVAVERSFWPAAIGELLLEEHLDDAQFYPLLERRGVHLKEADEQILAVNATEEEARILDVEAGEALLEMRRISYGVDGKPVEYTRTRYRSDRYSYRVRLRRG
jgi:GntR family transcriptional regulator